MSNKERGRLSNSTLGSEAYQIYTRGFLLSTAAMIKGSTPLDQLLVQDQDTELYERELHFAKAAHQYDDILVRLLKLVSTAGIPDDQFLNYFSKTDSASSALHHFLLGVFPVIIQRPIFKPEVKKIRADLQKLFNGGEIIVDPDDSDVIRGSINQGVSLLDTMVEVKRVNEEKVGLLQLQVDWLRTHPDISDDQEEINGEVVSVVESPQSSTEIQSQVAAEVAQPYLLSDWELFWTNRQFSSELGDLVAISTTGRSSTVRDFTEISRGMVSVKPSSIVRALEFHLQKDAIQRALAMRNKYVPAEIKDWIKLKRGKDRIFLRIPREGTAIFSVHGRDEAYEGLNRT